MGVNLTIPITNFTGTTAIPSTAVPAGATDVAIALDGAQMTDPALNVTLSFDFAPNGTDWRFLASTPMHGGAIDKHGNPAPSYGMNIQLPLEGSSRHVRGQMTVSGALLNTVATVTTTP